MNAPWPFVKLGEVLSVVSRPERVKRERQYRLLGMRWYANGLFLKEQKAGSDIKATTLYRVEPGDFLYNRLFAWKGSFGLAGDEVAGTHVSNEFPCFRINCDQMLPGFLKWFCAQEAFWERVSILSTGSSRQSRLRLKEERFLKLEIPLPPLVDQARLVSCLDQLAARLTEARRLRDEIADEQEQFLLSLARELADGAPREPLESVAPLVRRTVKIRPNQQYPEIAVRSFGNGTFQKPPLKGKELTWQKLFRVHSGDLLFSNIKAWEGAVAVVRPEDDGRVGSHRYLTCVPDQNKATAEFLCQWFLRGCAFFISESSWE